MNLKRFFKIVIAVLISLLICPGSGHATLGRKKAGWISFVIFLLVTILAGFFVNQLVRSAIFEMQKQDRPSLEKLIEVVTQGFKSDKNISITLWLLLLVYFLIPIELVFHEIFFPPKAIEEITPPSEEVKKTEL
ncbi:MAG: hypothetical protein HQM08_21315 [Candidatus Riflebacteria bacterium]|nr:hypothetical protein [Candidatus Riflebacteria bacterium]